MKKLMKLLVASLLMLSLVACTSNEETTEETPSTTGSVYQGVGNGYGGEVNVEVTFENDVITHIAILDNKETLVVAERAFPIIVERITEANTPVVDSVTGATFTSYAVKTAVADAMSQHGLEVEDIKLTTSGPEHEATVGNDINTDIVVVGAGPSGLAAAISAKQTNPEVDVILIEKLDILSGNGKFDLNFYDHFNSQAQADNGREVTKEYFIEAKQESGETAERIEAWANYGEGLDVWLRELNINLNYPYGGEMSMSHLAEANQYAGEVVQAGLEQAAYELGIEIITGTTGNELVLDGNTVVGVNVTNNDNVTYNIMAQNVILATGGFSNNEELLAKYAPGSELYNTSNQLGTTGDFVGQFEELNYSLVNMDDVRIYPTILVGSRDLTSGADVSFTVTEEGTIANSSMLVDQFYITDELGHQSFYRMQKHIAAGYYESFETLSELATAMGINEENLMTTISEYNASENAKREFGIEGPYYVAKVEPAIHMTKGGVETNAIGQVLTADKEVVEGLYASGEVTYQSGGYSQSTVFGIVAGENAAKDIK